MGLPSVCARVCHHPCETDCLRTHYDEPLAIREIKRFIMEHEQSPVLFEQKPPCDSRVAIIGAGPAGLSAAHQLAYAGFDVTIFEAHPYAGGMVGGAIPTYRLPQSCSGGEIAGGQLLFDRPNAPDIDLATRQMAPAPRSSSPATSR